MNGTPKQGGGRETGGQPASAAPIMGAPRRQHPVLSMRPGRATLICVLALFLFVPAVRAQADAGELGPTSDLASQDGTSGEDSAKSGGDLMTPIADSVASSYQPLTGKERWNLYLREAFWSPGVFFRAAGPALGAQLNNQPPAWGQGIQGYSKRFANRFGRFALQETYEAAGAAALGHEVRYIRSKRSGFFPRAAHALTANFVTYDRNGRRTPHVARVGSAFAAEFTGNLWMPAGYRDVSTAMRGVGMELGVGSAFNLIREFAPELKRIFTWK